jgi:hypothetical protein
LLLANPKASVAAVMSAVSSEVNTPGVGITPSQFFPIKDKAR